MAAARRRDAPTGWSVSDSYHQALWVIDGNVVFCPGGTPEHEDVTRTLAIRLEAARPAQPCTQVSTGADVHLMKRRRSDGTLSFRRPDISVYRCTEEGRAAGLALILTERTDEAMHLTGGITTERRFPQTWTEVRSRGESHNPTL
jgi:hypothetical protein